MKALLAITFAATFATALSLPVQAREQVHVNAAMEAITFASKIAER